MQRVVATAHGEVSARAASVLTPRLAIGGCQQTPGKLSDSFDMMIAMTADMTRSTDDLLPNIPVEIMALDHTTGLVNFYVLEPGATPDATATVNRFVRLPDDTVQKWTKVAGQAATKDDFPQRKCFNCHIHGDHVMNEITEPWTNWVSSHHVLSRPMTGQTHTLVRESRPFTGDPATNRSTLANQLEPIIKQALATWVEGIPGKPGSGFGPQTLAGKQPGGVNKLLESVFCQTAVNYGTVLLPDQVPTSLFVDTAVASLAAIEPPVPPTRVAECTLLPVRSEVDKRIEIFLEKQKILSPDTVMAARVLDDTNEVFSDKRCALHKDVTGRLAAGGTADAAAKAAILAAVGQDSSPAAAYIRVLVGASSDDRATVEQAYIADVTARFNTAAAQLQDDGGLATLHQKWTDRQASARAMFPHPENPLPLTQ